jgi:hypothetical protein
MSQRILTAHDGSTRCDAAFEVSMQLANCFGAELILLAIPAASALAGPNKNEEHERLGDLIVDLGHLARKVGVRMSGEIASSGTMTAINGYIRDKSIDHVVFPAVRDAAVDFFPAAELSRELPISVTLVHAGLAEQST